mgnify:CR=1 FL=1
MNTHTENENENKKGKQTQKKRKRKKTKRELSARRPYPRSATTWKERILQRGKMAVHCSFSLL